jgi:hypothetical protein
MFHGVLVLRARTGGGDPAVSGWQEGPLPIPIPGTGGRLTDAATRSTYYDRRAAQALYGSGVTARREHRFVDVPISTGGILSACAVERLRVQSLGDGWTYLLHVVGHDSDPRRVLDEWERLARWKRSEERRFAVEEVLRASTRQPRLEIVGPEADPYHIAFFSEAPDPIGRSVELKDADDWLLAAAIASAPAVPDLSDSERSRLLSSRIEISADWSALVLRDGAAFIAHPRDSSEFIRRFGSVYFRSIYIDAFVLGRLQQFGLRQLTDDLVDLQDPSRHPREIERLAARMNRFRNELWWQHLTEHGVANELLVALHRQHRIPELLEQVRSELADYVEQASLRAGRLLNVFAALFAVVGLLGVAVEVYRLAVVDEALPGFASIATIAAMLSVLALAIVLSAYRRTPRSWTRGSS